MGIIFIFPFLFVIAFVVVFIIIFVFAIKNAKTQAEIKNGEEGQNANLNTQKPIIKTHVCEYCGSELSDSKKCSHCGAETKKN